MSEQPKAAMVFPRLRKLASDEELNLARAAASQDGHALVYPTHWVDKDGEVVGAFSIGGLPVVTMWLDSVRVGPRESFSLINTVENLVAGAGWKAGAVLVATSSPFHPILPRLGYTAKASQMTLFIKQL